MFSSLRPAVMGAIIVAAGAAPLVGMAATPVPSEGRQGPCKLVNAPFPAHKTPYRSSRYVCGEEAYSISDPRLTRTRAARADRRQDAGADNGTGLR